MVRNFPSLQKIRHSFWGKWFSLAVIVGCSVAGVAMLFEFLIELVQFATAEWLAGFQPEAAYGEHRYFTHPKREFSFWWLIPTMALGGLLTGYLVHYLAPEARGAGTDATIDAFHNKRGMISIRVPLVKTLASAITLGTGGSAGREGPITQIGAGIGSYLGQRLKLSANDRRMLMSMGMAAGIGAIFRAPLAGAIFAGEILYRDADIEADVIVPSAVASTVAYAIFQSALPAEMRFTPMFGDQLKHQGGNLVELLPFGILACVLVFAAAVYIKVFFSVQRMFDALALPAFVKPMIGAAMAGSLGLFVFLGLDTGPRGLACLGSGYQLLQAALINVDQVSIAVLLAVAVAKILTTSFTICSGGSGGVFGPSLVIGGCVGAGVGKVLQIWMPTMVSQPSSYAIVGMAGFFAGCANAPFSTVLMVTEMTGDYKLLAPTLWVSAICFILCQPWSLYAAQVPNRIDSPAHRGDFTIDLLSNVLVKDVFKPRESIMRFQESSSLDEIVHALAKTPQRYFPVYNSDDELTGIFSAEDVRSYLYDDILWSVANAKDVMIEDVITLTVDEDLNAALNRFTALNVDELPVVSNENPNQIVGWLRRKEAIAAYNQRRLELKKQQQAEQG
ncbi:MAG: chloride channel protein [Planctomycetales bacterium]|nr:chloride channel protein [Planctomycetales bacterium]